MTFAGQARDYRQVISEYTRAAYESLGSSNVPEAMQEIVKDYFSDISE